MALALNFVKSLCIHGNCDKKTGWVVLDLTLLQPQSTQIIVVKEELLAMCVSTYVSLVKFHVELGFFLTCYRYRANESWNEGLQIKRLALCCSGGR